MQVKLQIVGVVYYNHPQQGSNMQVKLQIGSSGRDNGGFVGYQDRQTLAQRGSGETPQSSSSSASSLLSSSSPSSPSLSSSSPLSPICCEHHHHHQTQQKYFHHHEHNHRQDKQHQHFELENHPSIFNFIIMANPGLMREGTLYSCLLHILRLWTYRFILQPSIQGFGRLST